MNSAAGEKTRSRTRLLPGLAVSFLVLWLAGAPGSAAPGKPVLVTPQEMTLAPELKEREAEIVKKEKDLARREKALAALKKEVETKLEKLLALQREIKGKLASLESVKNKRFRNLIKVYSSMSASKVAPLLNQMEDNDAVEILRALKPEAVAKIIPKLNRDKAIRLSKQLGLD